MHVKLCDNCNEIAAVEEQDCISLDLPYDKPRHFCDINCLAEYLEKLKRHEITSKESELRETIVNIIGKEGIEKLHDMISKATYLDMSIERRCVYKILTEIFLE